MKKLFSFLLITGSLAVSAQPASTDANWEPTVKFKETAHDFGTIPEGPKVTHEFTFTNTGKEPVIIQDAKAGCGCTTPEWSSQPVLPGKSSVITVGFNSEGRPGVFNKEVTVTVTSGVNKDKSGTLKLNINGNVTAKAATGSEQPSKGRPAAVTPTKSTNPH